MSRGVERFAATAHSASHLEFRASGTEALPLSSSSRPTFVFAVRRHKIVATLFVAFALAAGTALAASPYPTSPRTDSAATTASPRAVTASAAAHGRHADPELEALLPTTLGGVALTIESQAGTDLATQSAAFDAFLASLGKTRADFSLASAYSQGGLEAEVGAWRVKGADPALLLPGFKTAMQASSATPLTQVEEILAGRAVSRIGDPGQLTRGPLYVVVRRDALLFVQTTKRALAEEAMEKLPR